MNVSDQSKNVRQNQNHSPGISAPPHITLSLARRRLLLHPLLQRQQLLRPERLVVDLRSRLNQVLQVCPRQKVAQVHKLAVRLVLHVHHPPAVLPPAHRLAINDHAAFGPNHSKRNDVLRKKKKKSAHHPIPAPTRRTHPDRLIQLNLLFVAVVGVKRIQPNVVVDQFGTNLSLCQHLFGHLAMAYLLLERLPLLQRQAVRLGNNRNHIHNFAQLFHHNDVNRTQRMSSRTDEVEAAVDARVLDVPVTHRRQLLAQIRAVLVLDVFHNGIPATPNQQHATLQITPPTSFRCSPGHRNQACPQCSTEA